MSIKWNKLITAIVVCFGEKKLEAPLPKKKKLEAQTSAI
jgi:hypothetical protein